MMNKFIRFITDKSMRTLFWNSKGLYNHLNDEKYLRKLFEARIGKKLDLNAPKTFNEKLQWLKLYDRKPEYATMVDKFEVKRYVSSRIGEEYIIPTLGVWEKYEDIEFESLPKQFVLKCTHDSGGVVICRDKNRFDYLKAKEMLDKHIKRDYYMVWREWPYKNVKPRIIAEQFMKDGENNFLPVYKFMCFHGEPRIIQTIQNDKQPNESIDYFDTEWNLLELRQNYPNSDQPLPKPEKLEKMCQLAKELSKDHAFLRVDFYVINGMIKFSEFTFYSDAGFSNFIPESWDNVLGDWIDLPQKK